MYLSSLFVFFKSRATLVSLFVIWRNSTGWFPSHWLNGSIWASLVNGLDVARLFHPTLPNGTTYKLWFIFVFVFLFIYDGVFLYCLFFFVVLYRMNPGFAKYRDLFDVPSARFVWYSESGHDIFFLKDQFTSMKTWSFQLITGFNWMSNCLYPICV